MMQRGRNISHWLSQADVKKAQHTVTAGLTLRSGLAAVVAMLLTGLYTQYVEVILAAGPAAEQSLPIPVMATLLFLIVLTGILYSLFRIRILTRPELFCVFFSMLIATPMMTQGLWHRLVGLLSAPPRTGSFEYLDAYNDKLWPHGKNLLENQLAPERVVSETGCVNWKSIEYEKEQYALLPEMVHSNADDVSSLSLTLPLPDSSTFVPTDPHLLSVLVRTQDTGPESFVFCRVYEEGLQRTTELLKTSKADKTTFIHQRGFVRLGSYGVTFPEDAHQALRLEFGLSGRGRAVFADPKLLNVSTLEGLYKGRSIMRRSEWAALDPKDRVPGIIIKPDHMVSLAGLAFLIKGYIPLQDWLTPALAWSSLILLLLAATMAMAIIMRKQWAESERYPFPLTGIPLAMIGVGEDREGGFAQVWRTPYLWSGFITAIVWGGLKGWHFYNGAVPDVSINIPLAPYFEGGDWGWMFDTSFTVSIMLVSIAIFFELNVLLSLVVGYWLYQSLGWVGETTNWKVAADYPWRYHQAVGAYLGYVVAMLFFTRKYLAQVVKQAVKSGHKEELDVLSYRSALLLLFGSFAGVAVWAHWMSTSITSMMLFFGFLVSIGFVSAKLRAECGLPAGYFSPYRAMIFVSMLGGMTAFGASSMMIALLCSGVLTVTVFFFIPGAQLELIEFGRRQHIHPRHILYTCLLGVLGGLFIGGWIFLSNSYALGGDALRYKWAYHQEWLFSTYKGDLANATTLMKTGQDSAAATSADWGTRTLGISAGVAVLLTVLRQLFSGFWFHPIGFILGSAHMMEFCWGSVLVAWGIRSSVLKLGGVNSIRNKLKPFFVGALAGSIVIATLFYVIGALAMNHGATTLFSDFP